MMRCASCGWRLPAPRGSCPVHGPVADGRSHAIAEEPLATGPTAGPAEASDAGALAGVSVPGFQLGGVLGAGGFGIVVRARRTADGADAAVKIADAGFAAAVTALTREGAALMRVGPPFAPQVFGHGVLPGGAAYLAMELVAARTLSRRMEDRPGPWPASQVASLASGVCAAVAAVHRAGLVHRDVKPENFFVGDDGAVRVFDLGLAADAGALPESGKAGEGTPEYMAPEQEAGADPIRPSVDVYAIGAMLYELLAGAPPFWGDAAQVREGHRSQRPVRFPAALGIPTAVEDLVLRCLAKDPSRRFADAGDLLRALTAAFLTGLQQADAARAAAPPAASTGADPAAPIVDASLSRPAAIAGAPASGPRPLAVIFARPRAGRSIGAPELKRLGGDLASASPALGVAAVFGHEAGENPMRKAYEAANRLVELGLASRVLVHVLAVTVHVRPNGARRYVAAALARPDSYPTDRDPEGVFATKAALELLANVETESVAERPGWLRVHAGGRRELTVVGAGPGRLVGRDQELTTLIAAATGAGRGRLPTVVSVIGGNGVGKSELASALTARLPLELPEAVVLALRCQEGLAGAESRTLRELLRWCLDLPTERPDDAGRACVHQALGPDAPWAALALAMGWMAPDAPELAELSAAPGALRGALARAAGDGLRARAGRQPVCLVIDDAHFADEITLDALEYATLKEAGQPIWVGVFARPAFRTVRDLFGMRAGRLIPVTLEPLAIEAQMAMARVLLEPVENVPAAALRKIAERTRGNPQLLVELIRGLKREGIVQRSSRGQYHLATELIDRLPELPAVQWLATREIEALPPDLAAHARLAAILGAEISDHEMEGVLALAESERRELETRLDAVVGLRRLVSAGVLVRHRTGRVSFRYEVLRDATYDLVPPDRRREVHDVAFRYFDAERSLPDDERMPRLALHAARSGRRDQAIDTYLKLADRARLRHAYLEAEGLYVRAAEVLGEAEDPRLVRATKGQAQMRFRQGRYEGARALFDETLVRAGRLGDHLTQVETLLDLATIFDFMLDYPRSRAAYEQAESLAPHPRSDLIQTRLRYAAARMDYRYSRVKEAIAGMLEAARAAEGLGPEAYETHIECIEVAASGSASLGDLDQAARLFDQAFALCAAHGDRLHEVSTYINRAFLWVLRGEFDRIRTDYERALVTSREYAFAFQEAMLVHNLAEVAYLLGDLDAADRHAQRAIELGERMSGYSAYYVVLERILRARIAITADRPADARVCLGEADRLLADSQAGQDPVTLAPSDQVLRDLADLATREASEDDWEALLSRSREVSVQMEPIETHAVRGLIAWRAGDAVRARAAFQQALDLAGRIPNCMEQRVRGWMQSASI